MQLKSAHLEMPAGQLRLPQQLLLAACLVVVQPNGDDGVGGNAAEARGLGCGEVRLEGLARGHLVGGLPGHGDLHQRVGQLVRLECHHHACSQQQSAHLFAGL